MPDNLLGSVARWLTYNCLYMSGWVWTLSLSNLLHTHHMDVFCTQSRDHQISQQFMRILNLKPVQASNTVQTNSDTGK